MAQPLIGLILAGGTGTRLYPATRSNRPKQFLSFGNDESLLTQTAGRLKFVDSLIVSTRNPFVERVREHTPTADILVEPEPKDTGPALVYAAHHLQSRFEDPIVVSVPSDHWISGAFEATIRNAAEITARGEYIVTIGIEPNRPATEYGYIQPASRRDQFSRVLSFHEKPDPQTARTFLDEGWYWNSGIFVWTPDRLLEEARHSPLQPLLHHLEEGNPDRGFDAIEPVSIDEAVMEQTDNAAVIPARFDWDDLGSWAAVDRHQPDEDSRTLELNATGNILVTDTAHITAIDVNNLVIAAYDDRILVVPKDNTYRIRDAVSRLQSREIY